MDVERSNLLAISQLVVRDLIHFANRNLVTIDGSHSISDEVGSFHGETTNVICRLLAVIENCLCHGLRRGLTGIDGTIFLTDGETGLNFFKNTTGILRRAKNQVASTAANIIKHTSEVNPWVVLLNIEEMSKFSEKISTNVLMMGDIRTDLGRTRVWLRHALMQKKLSEYFQVLIENKSGSDCGSNSSKNSCQNFSTFYHDGAMLLNDEGIVFTGLIGSLKFIDFCFIIKDNFKELDEPLQAVPYKFYLQNSLSKLEGIYSKESTYALMNSSTLLDQKKFLEESCDRLRKRVGELTKTNEELRDEIKCLNKSIDFLRLENQSLTIALKQLTTEKCTADSELEIGKSIKISLIESTERNKELESELKRVYEANAEKSELIESLRLQLADSNRRIQKLTHYLSDSQASLDHKQILIKQLESKSKAMCNLIEQMKDRIATMNLDQTVAERDRLKLQQEHSQLLTEQSECEKTIADQRSQIEQLSDELKTKWHKADSLQQVTEELVQTKLKMQQLQSDLGTYRLRCEEQESSLSEMAALVNTSKLEAENLRESYDILKDAQWASDASVSNCTLCRIAFGVSRRRHHCRNCGHIFCHDCSSQRMSLPSSAKPERVCDPCHTFLLQRYNSK